MTVDKNDAPDGYEAVASERECLGCAFSDPQVECAFRHDGTLWCSGRSRADKTSVILVEIGEREP